MTYGELQKRFDRWCSPVGYGGMLLAAVCFASFFIFYGEAAFVGKASTAGFGAWMLLAGALIGCLVGVGSLVYERHVEDRVLRPIREAWEKQFEDFPFLLSCLSSESGFSPLNDDDFQVLQHLWGSLVIQKTSLRWSVGALERRANLYPEGNNAFWLTLTRMLADKRLGFSDELLCIGPRLREIAKRHYPLDDFPVPEPPKLSALNIGLSE